MLDSKIDLETNSLEILKEIDEICIKLNRNTLSFDLARSISDNLNTLSLLGLRGLSSFLEKQSNLCFKKRLNLGKQSVVSGDVYFIKNSSTGHIKIGFSTNLKKRLAQLQGASSVRLEIVTVIPGDMSLEKTYHTIFKEKRLQGEWFDISLREVRLATCMPSLTSADLIDLQILLKTGTKGETDEEFEARLRKILDRELSNNASDSFVVVRNLMKQYPRDVKKQVSEFKRFTGLGRKTYYNRKAAMRKKGLMS